MQLKFLHLLLYFLSNRRNVAAAEDNNNKVSTKYIYQFNTEGNPYDMEANNFYEKISIMRFKLAE